MSNEREPKPLDITTTQDFVHPIAMNDMFQKQIDRCLDSYRLTVWEVDFVLDLGDRLTQGFGLTGKQAEKLSEIDRKVKG